MNKYKLICFDLDETLVELYRGGPYWNTLHVEMEGVERGTAVQEERIARFRKGELDYKEWVDLDLRSFQEEGATREQFLSAARRHSLMPGTKEAIAELHRRGYKLGIISGSVNTLIDALFPDHPFEDIFVNKVFFDEEGKLSHWEGTVYDEGTKHKALHAICEREGISLAETVFVGDGINDIDILKEAGLGIAFCAKNEKVRTAADIRVEKRDMREILKFL